MDIGSEILRQVNNTVDQIDSQFSAIRFIDQFDLDHSNIIEFYSTVASTLNNIAGSISTHVLFQVDGQFNDWARHPKIAKEFAFSSPQIFKESNNLKPVSLKANERTVFSMFVGGDGLPRAWLVIVDNYFGRGTANIHQKSFKEFAEYLSEKVAKKLRNFVQTKQLKNFENLSQSFLSKDHQDEQPDGSLSQIYEAGWDTLLSSLGNYLPNWGPFEFPESLPKVQLLTVEKGRRYLNLRAESSPQSIQLVDSKGQQTGFRNMRLNRSKTVSGICLEREENGEHDSYLLFNPLENKTIRARYASFLYDGNGLPGSELIVPIRNAQNRISTILNLEHLRPGVFRNYHVEQITRFAEDISHFANFIILEREGMIENEKELRYSLMRVTGNLSQTHKHKTGNDYGELISALYEAKRQIKVNEVELACQEIETANQIADELKKTSLDFGASAKEYIEYKVHDLDRLLKDAVVDSQRKLALKSDDNVEITLNLEPLKKKVFCSGMLKEHFYNIIQNSIDQFVDVRKTQPDFLGEINISVAAIDGEEDNNGAVVSHGFFVVSFKDNGGGINEKNEELIFVQKFTTKSKGTGFGLTAARSYMLNIGGDLLLDNQQGIGAEFNIKVPMYTDELHDGMAEQLNLHSVKK